MKKFALRAGPALAVVALAMSGCVTTEPVTVTKQSREPIPADVIDAAFDSSTAEQIAAECPGEFRYNRAYEKALRDAIVDKYSGGDTLPEWATGDIDERLSNREIQDKILGYIRKRDIVVMDKSSWCAAGRAEVAENTRMGKHLIAR